MIAEAQIENLLDVLRLLLVFGLFFLGGALGYTYLWLGLKHRSKEESRRRMMWGAASAMCFILGAIIEEHLRFGGAFTWRLPLYFAGVVFGIVALRTPRG